MMFGCDELGSGRGGAKAQMQFSQILRFSIDLYALNRDANGWAALKDRSKASSVDTMIDESLMHAYD